jgi:hypothetical protein
MDRGRAAASLNSRGSERFELDSSGRMTEKVGDMLKRHFTTLRPLRRKKEIYFASSPNCHSPTATPFAP